MRKVIIYICCMSVLLSSLVVPVFADPGFSLGKTDILTASEYIVKDMYATNSESREEPTFSIALGSYGSIAWESPIRATDVDVFLAVRSTVQLSTVRIGSNANDQAVASLYSSSGYYYIYQIRMNVTSDIYLRLHSGNGTAYGYVLGMWFEAADRTYISNCSASLSKIHYVDGKDHDEIVGNINNTFSGNLSFSDTLEFSEHDFSYDYWVNCSFNLPSSNITYSSFVFRASNVKDVTAALILGDSSTFNPLPVEVQLTKYNWIQGDHLSSGYLEYDTYRVAVDLSNYDLSDYDRLMISVNGQYLQMGATIYESMGFQCWYWDYYIPTLDYDPPWYKIFWSWLTKPLNKIIDLLSDQTNDTSGKVDQNAEDIADQSSELEDLNEQLQAVTKPTVQVDQIVQDNISIGADNLTIMSSVLDTERIVPMLMIVCSMALLGYILFGSKGG